MNMLDSMKGAVRKVKDPFKEFVHLTGDAEIIDDRLLNLTEKFYLESERGIELTLAVYNLKKRSKKLYAELYEQFMVVPEGARKGPTIPAIESMIANDEEYANLSRELEEAEEASMRHKPKIDAFYMLKDVLILLGKNVRQDL